METREQESIRVSRRGDHGGVLRLFIIAALVALLVISVLTLVRVSSAHGLEYLAGVH